MSDDETPKPDEASNEATEPAATEPGDPARPAEDDAPDSAQPPNGGASDRPDGAGVSIPSWLAGALVVVLALLIAGAGFAIGRATAPDDNGNFRPVFATEGDRQNGGPGGDSRTFPGPGGGPGGLPGFPGGPDGRGGDGEGPRAVPGFPGERDRTYDDGEGSDEQPDGQQDDSGSSDTPALPQLPGT
jgi:hypothetical protein